LSHISGVKRRKEERTVIRKEGELSLKAPYFLSLRSAYFWLGGGGGVTARQKTALLKAERDLVAARQILLLETASTDTVC
jgi:hypothetical protein